MNLRGILIVGTALADIVASKATGKQVHVLAREGSVQTLGALYDSVRTLPDSADEDAWAEAVFDTCKRWPIDQVVAFGERYQLATALGADMARLPGLSPLTVVNVYDKYRMRTCLGASGLSSLTTDAFDNLAEAYDFMSREPGDWIVKPRCGSGSAGVYRMGEGRNAPTGLLGSRRIAGVQSSCGFVVEPFYSGRLLSVDAFHDGSVNHVVALCEAFFDPVTFGETGRVIPADLTKAEEASVLHLVFAALDALGVRRGPTHTEVILGASGPEVVETHVRWGGDSIPRLVKLATGLDLHQLLFDALIEGDVSALLDRPSKPRQAAANWFGVAQRPGVLGSMHLDPAAFDGEYVPLKKPGDCVAPGAPPNDRRLFEVLVTSQSPGDAITQAKHVGRLVNVDIQVSESCL